MIESETNGIFVIYIIKIIMVCADDIGLVSDSVVDLQKKLLPLEFFCQKWNIKVNIEKSEIIVEMAGMSKV